MRKSIFFGLAFLLCQTTAMATDHDGIPSSDSHEYGQTLVTEFDVPADEIAKFNAHVAHKIDSKVPLSGMEKMVSTMADSEDWVGIPVNVDAQKNPYRVVLTLKGTAVNAGDVTSMWAAGWQKNDGVTHTSPIAGLIKQDLKAGDYFVVTAGSAPNSFKDNQAASPAISLVKSQNMTINSVHVQVWSGVPSASWTQIFFALRILVIALVMLGLRWYFKSH